MNTFKLNIISIIKYIFLFCFISYFFISIYKFGFTVNMLNITAMTQDFINNDWFLRNWDLSYCSSLFTHIFYYFAPVKIFGTTNAAITTAVLSIFFLSIVSGILLIKDNVKDITISDILLFVCFLSISKPFFELIMTNGAYIPFVFLILYFSNKFLQSERKIDLILASILSFFLVFGDVLSIVLCIIPITVYCLISIFYNSDSYRKYLKLLIAIIFASIAGIFIYSQYVNLNGNSLFYGYLSSQHFLSNFSNSGEFKDISLIIKFFLDFQNANFIHKNLFSGNSIFCLYKLIIISSAIIMSLKNTHSTFCNKKEANDFISFALSFGLICIFFFTFLADMPKILSAEHFFVFIPFSMAIIILRYTNCFKNLFPFRKNIILITSMIIVLLFLNWNVKEHLIDFKNNYDLRQVETIYEQETMPNSYIRRISEEQ